MPVEKSDYFEKLACHKVTERIFEKAFVRVYNKYKIVKPYLTLGNYSNQYNPRQNTIFIYDWLGQKPKHAEHIIVHELLHAVICQLFPDASIKTAHNKKFYELCKEFGLPFKHDGIISKTKRSVYGNL
jgi:hypothetical protein